MDVTAFFFSLLKFECSYLGLGYASDSFFRLVKSTDVVFRCVALIWFIRGFYFQHFWFFFFNLKILISLVKFYFHVAGVFICTAYFLTHLADFPVYYQRSSSRPGLEPSVWLYHFVSKLNLWNHQHCTYFRAFEFNNWRVIIWRGHIPLLFIVCVWGGYWLHFCWLGLFWFYLGSLIEQPIFEGSVLSATQ